MKWNYLDSNLPQTQEELFSLLLNNRGITDQNTFFHPPHPSQLTTEQIGIDSYQLSLAADMIWRAVADKEQIVIFGDYDADGICATAVLWQALAAIGCPAKPFIPLRDKHGYGVSHTALDDIAAEKKPSLLITVDNGIVAHEAIQHANDLGIEVIITDHHQPEATFPAALAVVHTTQLCGATVAWMLSRELLTRAKKTQLADTLLDFCGIATIADQVPLVGANRSFAWHGLTALQHSQNPGIMALLKIINPEQAPITSTTVGFSLAPRLNAMGRLAHGLDALRLLCTTSAKTAHELAELLTVTNQHRQELTQSLLDSALRQAETQADERLLIINSSEFHEGIIGLLAGRLVEVFSKPAIVLSEGGQTAKASARSIPGVNIVELIRQVREDLLSVGGHPMAAGFGVELAKLESVKKRLHQVARKSVELDLLLPTLELDCALPLALCTANAIKALDRLAPFGAANPRPVFAITGVTILAVQTMGKMQEHLKLVVGQPGSANPGVSASTIEVVGWRLAHKAGELKTGQVVDLAGSLELNEWRGKAKVQVVLKDLIKS